MQFRIQDILKNILPAILFLMLILIGNIISNISIFPKQVPESIKDLSAIVVLIFLATSYTLGYFLDGLSSLIERKLLYRWFSKPSFKLLNGKNKTYILDSRKEIIDFLCEKRRESVPSTITKEFAISLFRSANLIKDINSSSILKEKVSEYYNAYIFSRNLMITLFLCLVYNASLIFNETIHNAGMSLYTIALGILFVLSIIRWRDKAYYYSRQVFYASYKVEY